MTERRVLHLITRFLDGGAETTTVNALRALGEASEAYDLRLGVGAEHDPDGLERVERLGVEPVVFDSIRHYNPIAAAVAVPAVARYLRRERIDVLHTHSTEAGVIGRFAGRLAGTPAVVHEIHGDPITGDRSRALNAFVWAMERLAAPLATRLVVKSERVREAFLDREIGRPDQYELVYHGVPVEEFRRAARARADGDGAEGGEAVQLLFVGRLAEGKGLPDLLAAVDRLCDGHDLELRIAGDGPLADALAERVDRRGLGGEVELLGYRDDVPELMAAADVFVLPSYREGTPRVVTEALAAGLPVVATDVAGLPEQVADGETGYLVRPGDRDALADRLERLIESPELRAEMGRRAPGTVDRFAVERAAERYRALYRDLATGVADQSPSKSP